MMFPRREGQGCCRTLWTSKGQSTPGKQHTRQYGFNFPSTGQSEVGGDKGNTIWDMKRIAAVAHAFIGYESQIVKHLTGEASPIWFVGSSCLKCVQIQMLVAQVLLRKMTGLP